MFVSYPGNNTWTMPASQTEYLSVCPKYRMDLYKNLPNKLSNTVVIDPPWPLPMTRAYALNRHKMHETLPYSTLTLPEIATFPVQQLLAPGGHCYLWTTNRFLHDAFHLLEQWGLRYHLTMPLVKKSGIVGANGYVFGAEYRLLAFNGKPMQKFVGIGKLNWLVTSPVAGKHSVKPDAFYDLVESMSPGPYLDCFARRQRKGWTTWGNECPQAK